MPFHTFPLLQHGLFPCCSEYLPCCGAPPPPPLFFGVLSVVSYSFLFPPFPIWCFLPFLKNLFTEVPQTSLMGSAVACSGFNMEPAASNTGQSLTSCHRDHPCSTPLLPESCHVPNTPEYPFQWYLLHCLTKLPFLLLYTFMEVEQAIFNMEAAQKRDSSFVGVIRSLLGSVCSRDVGRLLWPKQRQHYAFLTVPHYR